MQASSRHLVIGGRLAHLAQSAARTIVFGQHHPDRVFDRTEAGRRRRLCVGTLFAACDVGEQYLVLFHQVQGEFIGQRGKRVANTGELGMIGPVLRVDFFQSAWMVRNLLADVDVMRALDVLDQVSRGPLVQFLAGAVLVCCSDCSRSSCCDVLQLLPGRGACLTKGLLPAAAIIDSELFENLNGRREFEYELANGSGSVDSHVELLQSAGRFAYRADDVRLSA